MPDSTACPPITEFSVARMTVLPASASTMAALKPPRLPPRTNASASMVIFGEAAPFGSDLLKRMKIAAPMTPVSANSARKNVKRGRRLIGGHTTPSRRFFHCGHGWDLRAGEHSGDNRSRVNEWHGGVGRPQGPGEFTDFRPRELAGPLKNADCDIVSQWETIGQSTIGFADTLVVHYALQREGHSEGVLLA